MFFYSIDFSLRFLNSCCIFSFVYLSFSLSYALLTASNIESLTKSHSSIDSTASLRIDLDSSFNAASREGMARLSPILPRLLIEPDRTCSEVSDAVVINSGTAICASSPKKPIFLKSPAKPG